jgi:hypothetical protein
VAGGLPKYSARPRFKGNRIHQAQKYQHGEKKPNSGKLKKTKKVKKGKPIQTHGEDGRIPPIEQSQLMNKQNYKGYHC